MLPQVRRREPFQLSRLGVRIHDRRRWNVVVGSNPRGYWHARSIARFHTTQDRVWIDGVEDKEALLLLGRTLHVTVAPAPEFGDRDFWVCNGHHTLGAYLHLDRAPLLRYFDRAQAGHRVAVPTFDQWATR